MVNMKQFDIYLVELNPGIGSEIHKTRPCVIISPDEVNKHLKTVVVAPVTHTIKNFPSRVPSIINDQRGEIVLDQIRAIDKIRLKKKLGTLDKQTGLNIKSVMKTMFS
jgi:mRNA interferase MazF